MREKATFCLRGLYFSGCSTWNSANGLPRAALSSEKGAQSYPQRGSVRSYPQKGHLHPFCVLTRVWGARPSLRDSRDSITHTEMCTETRMGGSRHSLADFRAPKRECSTWNIRGGGGKKASFPLQHLRFFHCSTWNNAGGTRHHRSPRRGVSLEARHQKLSTSGTVSELSTPFSPPKLSTERIRSKLSTKGSLAPFCVLTRA